MTRHVIVVDCETTGLDPAHHQTVEVSWWDLTTDERGYFIPQHDVSDALANADVAALRLNRYIDRIAGEPQGQIEDVARLAEVLSGNTLAGSNPAFDSAFLTAMFEEGFLGKYVGTPAWHHRLWDLAAYAAGVLGLDHLPGLAEVCELLDLSARPAHSADADVTATGLAFLELFRRAGLRGVS